MNWFFSCLIVEMKKMKNKNALLSFTQSDIFFSFTTPMLRRDYDKWLSICFIISSFVSRFVENGSANYPFPFLVTKTYKMKNGFKWIFNAFSALKLENFSILSVRLLIDTDRTLCLFLPSVFAVKPIQYFPNFSKDVTCKSQHFKEETEE